MKIDPEEYEFYEEWLNRDPELAHMSLEEYDEIRCVESYGLAEDELGDDDDF